jgi:hypothetical protein
MSLIFYGKNFKLSTTIGNYSTYLELFKNLFKITGTDLSNYKMFNNNFEEIDLNGFCVKNNNIFLCDINEIIKINFNNTNYNIPSFMSICEFKIITGIQKDIFNIYSLEMFSDEYFTDNSIYYTKEP